jgi:hypothetical protein
VTANEAERLEILQAPPEHVLAELEQPRSSLDLIEMKISTYRDHLAADTASTLWSAVPWLLVSAWVMTFLLVRGSDTRLLESTIGQRRSGYADYVARTGGFLPLPPRRRPSRGSGQSVV